MPASANPPASSRRFAAGLLQRRECFVPTWRGWLVLVLVVGLVVAGALRFTCAFLTVHDPVPGGALVVEGWMSPDAAREVLAEFQRGSYTALYVTGGPIEADSPLAAYGSYAELTADVLRRVGADPAKVHAVAGPKVARDRTYSTAVALKASLRETSPPVSSLTLMTGATHSRRSRLLYEKAFGSDMRIGTIALEERDFDPKRWWTSSAGFRTVVGEFIAYLYARLLFRPAAPR
jgi:hypothetical protein